MSGTKRTDLTCMIQHFTIFGKEKSFFFNKLNVLACDSSLFSYLLYFFLFYFVSILLFFNLLLLSLKSVECPKQSSELVSFMPEILLQRTSFIKTITKPVTDMIPFFHLLETRQDYQILML